MTYTETLTMVKEDCCNCGVTFGITKEMQGRLRENGNRFFCPNGHGMSYGASTLKAQIKKQSEELKQAYTRLDNVRDQRDSEQRSKNAYKGRVTRLKNRASKGLCPCCNKQFKSLTKHMANEHPDFNEEDHDE